MSSSTGGEALSVQHWAGAETADPAELLLQGEEVRDRLTAAWQGLAGQLHNSMQVYPAEQVIVVDLTPPQLLPMSTVSAIAGTSADNPLPWATQGIITLRDGSATRAGRGRIFIPCFTEASNTTGVPVQAAIDGMNAFADDLATPVGITPVTLGIYHRLAGTITSVGTAAARNYWAYLGSRRD